MLKTLFNQYKWWALLAIFLVYSVGMWNVSSTYNDASWNRKELQRTEKFIEIQADNDKLREDISKLLQKSLAEHDTKTAAITKEITNAILNDSRYKSCRTTDSVRNSIQRQLNSQSK